MRRRATRAGFGGGCGRAASRRRREREEKVTTWDSNGSWSRWSPWPRLSPPRGVALGKRTRVVWVGEKQPVWVARESRALGPTTKAASLDEAPVLVRKSAAHPGLGGARAAPTATQPEARNFRQVSDVSASARATLRSHAEARYARWVWGGMRQSRLPPTQGERREGHDLGFQRLLEPLVPLAAPFPPLLRQDGTLSCGSPPPHARAVAIHGRRHVDAALALGCDSVTTCTRDMAAARLRTASRAAYT
jgi:hypothetical protein